jgi:hypothetical protein
MLNNDDNKKVPNMLPLLRQTNIPQYTDNVNSDKVEDQLYPTISYQSKNESSKKEIIVKKEYDEVENPNVINGK